MICSREQSLLPRKVQAVSHDVIGAVEQRPDLLKLFKFLPSLKAMQALTSQTHTIQTPHPAWMAFDKTVRRNITIHTGHAANHRHAADVNELMNP
jgi:hypothetical protein